MTPAYRQRIDALQKANATRQYRAEIKEAIETGRLDPADVVDHLDPRLRTMQTRDLLLAVPGVGPQRANTIMHARLHCRSTTVTLGDLTYRQRALLIAEFDTLERRAEAYRKRAQRAADRGYAEAWA